MTAPVFTNLDSTITAALGVPIIIDSNATVTDPDLAPGASYGNTSLRFAASVSGTFGASGTLAFTGTDEVRLNGVQIGTFAQADSSINITFNASATAADVAGVLQQTTLQLNPPGPQRNALLEISFADQFNVFGS